MHSFHYHKGQLRCEEVDLAALAAEHDTPLYVYSARTIQDHYRRLDAALDGLDHMICYAVKANQQPRRPGPARARAGRVRHRLGGRAVPRAERRRQTGVLHVRRSGQNARRDRVRPAPGSALLQRRERGRAGDDQRRGGRHGPPRAGRPAHQPGRGGRRPQVHLHRQEREQVRHRHRARAGGLRRRRQDGAHPPARGPDAHRLADHRGRAVRPRGGEGGSRRPGAEARVRHRVLQRRRGPGHRVQVVARKRPVKRGGGKRVPKPRLP